MAVLEGKEPKALGKGAVLDPELVRRARAADLVAFLQAKGYRLKREGSGNYRVVGHQGLIVQGSRWYWHSHGTGGNAVEFLMRVLGYPFRDAVLELSGGVPRAESLRTEEASAEAFALPEPGPDCRRLYAYLIRRRGLPTVLVQEVVRRRLAYQDRRGNVVWVCRDREGAARGAFLEGTGAERFKGVASGSDCRCPWRMPLCAGPVRVFESPVDALSWWTLRPRERDGTLVALGGLKMAALEGALDPGADEVVLMVDADAAGREFAARAEAALAAGGYRVRVELPPAGDWNDVLRSALAVRP